MPTQRAITLGLVNEYQRKLGSKRAYHTIHWPRIRGLAASAGVRLRATGNGDSAAPWVLRLRKRLYFTLLMYNVLSVDRHLLVKNLQSPFTASCSQGACILEVKLKVLFVVGKTCFPRLF